MEDVKQYILSVVACSIISGLAVSMFGKKGLYASIIKLIAGLFLAVTVISPWTKLRFDDLSSYFAEMQLDTDEIVEGGEEMAVDAAASIIKEQVEAYILDKACSLDLDIEVEVTVTASNPPIPSAVTVKGAASPYARSQLQQIIADELGIPKENQIWT